MRIARTYYWPLVLVLSVKHSRIWKNWFIRRCVFLCVVQKIFSLHSLPENHILNLNVQYCNCFIQGQLLYFLSNSRSYIFTTNCANWWHINIRFHFWNLASSDVSGITQVLNKLPSMNYLQLVVEGVSYVTKYTNAGAPRSCRFVSSGCRTPNIPGLSNINRNIYEEYVVLYSRNHFCP